uniref:Acireductone dioxygenase n=1 Tax=Panagrolaimus sp. JU765 TaxID=591449 RepID=A0AC34QBX6_9BILA
MVKLWLMSETFDDPRSECHRKPPEILSLDSLEQIGVLYYHYDTKNGLDSVAKERNYDYQDEVVINRGKLPNYDEKIKMFFEEHLHTDEEIRYVVDGSGYFDVRDKNDNWIRILVETGDLIILPAGIYHRFTPDHSDYIHVIRMFRGNPKWEAHNRSQKTENMEERLEYTKSMK